MRESNQDRIERHTLDLLQTAPVQAAARAGEALLRASVPDADAPSLARLPDVATEVALNALVGVADGYSGEDLPRWIMRPPHELAGERVPGNRGLHDNPDTVYRLIPLDGLSDFVLEGQLGEHPATIFEFSALTSQWQTLANLTKAELGLAPGKRFRIHLGHEPGPAVDRFVRSAADAEMLLVRETLADWALERPCQLRIENRVDRGGPRERDDAAAIAAAAARVEKWFASSIQLTTVPLSQPANHFPVPVISGELGKLVTMAYSIGHFWVRPGEALVLNLHPGLAEYVVAPVTNLWGTTNPGLARGASWNSKQAALNADGSFTCVLSLEDPGVHNWLDPAGLERGFLFLRWAGLDPEGPSEPAPGLRTQLVPLAKLGDVLPAETRFVGESERRTIFDQRERDYVARTGGDFV